MTRLIPLSSMEEKAHPTTHVLFLILSLLFSTTVTTLASSTTDPIFATAAQILTDSGFLSMALTLRLAAPFLRLPSTAATIFVPPNSAFIRSGSLPLSLLQYHILPSKISLEILTSFPPNTSLRTLHRNSYLTLSSHPPEIILNDDVVVSNTTIYDDDNFSLIGIDNFLTTSSLRTPPSIGGPFDPIASVLKSNGSSIFASFLEAQLLMEVAVGKKLTIFAPLDFNIDDGVSNISDYSAIFRKHVVPSLIPWRELVRLPDGTLLPTFFDGFWITVNVYPRRRFLNGVPVAVPDMYRSNHVVVHGIRGLLDSGSV